MTFPFKIRLRLRLFPCFRPWDTAVRLMRPFRKPATSACSDSLPWQETILTSETITEIASCEPALPDFPKKTILTAFSPEAGWTHVIEADTTLAACIFGLPVPPRDPQTIVVHMEPLA